MRAAEKRSAVRLDKWLQSSRLVKRRVVAKELCDGGHVRVNGRIAKPGAEVGEGDALQIDFGWRLVEVRLTALPERAGRGAAAAATSPYDVVLDLRRAETGHGGTGGDGGTG